jgi:hypothetical protein
MDCSTPLSASKQHTGKQIDSAHEIVLKEQQAAQEWQRLALDLGHESDEAELLTGR